jgi:hypothetical protein
VSEPEYHPGAELGPEPHPGTVLELEYHPATEQEPSLVAEKEKEPHPGAEREQELPLVAEQEQEPLPEPEQKQKQEGELEQELQQKQEELPETEQKQKQKREVEQELQQQVELEPQQVPQHISAGQRRSCKDREQRVHIKLILASFFLLYSYNSSLQVCDFININIFDYSFLRQIQQTRGWKGERFRNVRVRTFQRNPCLFFCIP